MSNFFAQPDALANGKSLEAVLAEGTPAHLAAHKVGHSACVFMLVCVCLPHLQSLLSSPLASGRK